MENETATNSQSSMRLLLALTVLMTLVLSAKAGKIRLSLLAEADSLHETVAVLVTNGCSPEAASVLNSLVDQYYAETFPFDRSKFPAIEKGFHSFASINDAIKALPHRLCETEHAWGLNCFDTVFLLADGHLKIRLRPDENFGPFMISQQQTNGGEIITFAATPRDAFTNIYSGWYREITDAIVPTRMQSSRIGLTATFFRWRLLPEATTEATLERNVLDALQSDWRRAGVTFPSKFQVVLYHKAELPAKSICTSHAGLLFPREGGFTYLEKAGGSGPFVRLDFDERPDLQAWSHAIFSERERQTASLFITFNDTAIVRVSE